MVEFYAKWVAQYPIISIEDGMAEDDWDGWKAMTDALARRSSWSAMICSSPTPNACKRASIWHREFDSGEGQPDWLVDRNAGHDAPGRRRELHARWFRIVLAKPKMHLLRIWRSPPMRDKSRLVLPAAQIELPNTISCCVLKKNSGSAAVYLGKKAFRQ